MQNCRTLSFLGSVLHRGLDGTKVMMFGHRESMETYYEAIRQDPRPFPLFQEALEIATFDPGAYEVSRDFTPKEK